MVQLFFAPDGFVLSHETIEIRHSLLGQLILPVAAMQLWRDNLATR
jgi:hypothetical protein